MKRYAAFKFEQFYPGGGWNDFSGSYDTISEAKKHGNQIVDLTTGKVVSYEEK